MSHQLLEKVATHLVMAGLLDGMTIKYFRWTDADVNGAANFIMLRMAGSSGIRDAIVQSPDIKILIVGKADEIKQTNEKADAIFANFAGLTTPLGILKLDPLAIVTGPYYLDNGRCVFEINVRAFVTNTQMSIFDAQSFAFVFNGQTVGGITKFSTIDGVTPDISHNPLGANERFFMPGLPDFGSLILNIYRDFSDAGQIAMEAARASSLKVNCGLTFSNGTGFTFPGYVKKLPIVGIDNGLGTAEAVIKIAGKTASV